MAVTTKNVGACFFPPISQVSILVSLREAERKSYNSGREAPSLKMQTVFVLFGVELSRLRSAALITSLFRTRKMADACLTVCI